MLTVAIIGTGGMGKVHSDCYKALQGAGQEIEIIAAADIEFEKTTRVTDVHPEARAYDSLTKLLDNESPDIVHITTPSDTHAALTIEALQHDCHVFCEKPIALTLQDAQRMADAAEAAGKFLMVGQVLRFWEQYRYLKTLIETKQYGSLRVLRLQRAGQAPGWDTRSWFLELERSGRAPIDLHLHDVDFLNYLFGKPKSVYSTASDDQHSLSYISTSYDYGNGIDIRAEGGWVKAPIGFTFGYEAIFDEAMVLMKDDKITLYPVGGEAQAVEPAQTLSMDSGINLSNMGPYVAEIAYFHDCVRKNSAPTEITPRSALESLAIALQEVEAAQTGQ